MKIGIPIGNFGTYGRFGGAGDVVDIAERAELLGFDSVWVHDHIFMPARIDSRYPYNDSGVAGFAYRQDIYDPLAMMAAVAVRTQRVQIGTSVLIVPYRDPLHQAQMIATLDQLSHGRILLGIGVGWMEEEFDALGLGGDTFKRRGAVTDEWMRICIAAWAAGANGRTASYGGEFRSFEDMGGLVGCVQRPHVPIWVGGKGPIAARRVARYGDGYHTITSTPDEVRAEVAQVREEVERAGRDPSEIEVSMLGPMVLLDGDPDSVRGFPAVAGGEPEQIVERLAEYGEAGLDHALVIPAYSTPNWDVLPERQMEAMGEMAEIVSGLRQVGPVIQPQRFR